jgi:hypothetical protein
MRTIRAALFLFLFASVCLFVSSAQTQTQGQQAPPPPPTNSQGTSAPTPDPSLHFSLWQQTTQSTTASADMNTQFQAWLGQRTTADSINLFKCTTSTDLDNPECVGKLPGTKITGTKDAKTPKTRPVRKSKTGAPD